MPLSVETSPATATPDRLAVLAAHGVHRVSIGVQSFLDAEAHAAGRPQRRAEVERGAGRASATAGFPVLNLDLIYGIPGQTPQTWRDSLRAALAWQPEELYLYPLYVRPLTGLGQPARRRAGSRLGRAAARPLPAGPRPAAGGRLPAGVDAPVPARRRARPRRARLLLPGRRHGRPRLRGPLVHAGAALLVRLRGRRRRGARRSSPTTWRRPAADFAHAEVGFALDERRAAAALAAQVAAARRRASTWPAYAAPLRRPTCDDDFPQLARAGRPGLARRRRRRLRLTAEGLAHSDAIGPWLFSRRGAGGDGAGTRCDEPVDPLPRAAGELQLRLPVLPVRQAARQPPEQLRADRAALDAVRRLGRRQPGRATGSSVLFTPWGEALTRSWYRRRAGRACRTCRTWSGSRSRPTCPAGWTGWPRPTRRALALWAPTTPARSAAERFLAACATLRRARRPLLRRRRRPARAPRRGAWRCAPRCPATSTCGSTPPTGTPTTPTAEAAWTAIDPLFGYSVRPHASAGPRCRAGETVDLGARRRHGAPLPLRRRAARQPLRRLVPGRAAARGRAPNAHVRLPHRLRPPQTAWRCTRSSPAACSSASRPPTGVCPARRSGLRPAGRYSLLAEAERPGHALPGRCGCAAAPAGSRCGRSRPAPAVELTTSTMTSGSSPGMSTRHSMPNSSACTLVAPRLAQVAVEAEVLQHHPAHLGVALGPDPLHGQRGQLAPRPPAGSACRARRAGSNRPGRTVPGRRRGAAGRGCRGAAATGRSVSDGDLLVRPPPAGAAGHPGQPGQPRRRRRTRRARPRRAGRAPRRAATSRSARPSSDLEPGRAAG